MKKTLLIFTPLALLLGAGLAALQPGRYGAGWMGFSALLWLGFLALFLAWRRAGGGRRLAWMVALALLLRLAAGVAVYIALPLDGYDEPDDRAGYVFTDAHRRDDQAWELAHSNRPLWEAFNKTYSSDQYGGLLALSALTYKTLSPDAHRPLLILLLAALSAALGVPFFYAAVRLLWDEGLACLATWLFVLYPESVLTGGAQMREPFLLTFIAVCLWGCALWWQHGRREAWGGFGLGLLGLLLVSPGIALVVLVLLGGWLWSLGERKRLPRPLGAALGSVFLLGLWILAWSLSRQHDFGGGSPLAVILNWMRDSVKWVIYQLERGSGQVQNVFSKMNPLAQFLFVIGYGIAQPVLPPAFFEPTTLTWRVIAILRAAGWYAALPLLLYAPFAAWRSAAGAPRRAWLWLSFFSWSWILICAVRGGGDQWDNPRYRLIFWGVQALVAGYAWRGWRLQRDAWLPRILLLEALCLILYGEWYLARYYAVGVHLPAMRVLVLSLGLAGLVFAGGWLWDRWRARSRY